MRVRKAAAAAALGRALLAAVGVYLADSLEEGEPVAETV